MYEEETTDIYYTKRYKALAKNSLGAIFRRAKIRLIN